MTDQPTDVVFKGGTVYTPAGPREVDVQVSGGVIVGIGEEVSAPDGAREVDIRGKWLLPGAIDVHVHSRDPGFPDKEDFGTLTAAAAAGGVTTVVDMPNTVPGVDSAGVLESKAALARAKARVDFGLWGLVRSSSTSAQLEGLASAGAVGFKAYLGYAFSLGRKQVLYTPDLDDPDLEAPPDYGTLARLAPTLAALRLPLVIHAEDPGILTAFRRPFQDYADILAARPPEAEAVAISAAAAVAGQAGFQLHVAHLSSELGLKAALEAVHAGCLLTLETCPQYLWLSDEDFGRLGTAMKVFPPIRTAADREALRQGLAAGDIGIVATDHAPHTDAEKGRTLEDAPSGSPGVQTLYLSCLELARRLGDPWMAPRWVSEAPARLIGMGGRKGAVAPGYDADLVVVDPRGRTVVRPERMLSRQRHGDLDGLAARYAIRAVYVRGTLVAQGGRVRGKPAGRMVSPV